jgi:hypothetical protein
VANRATKAASKATKVDNKATVAVNPVKASKLVTRAGKDKADVPIQEWARVASKAARATKVAVPAWAATRVDKVVAAEAAATANRKQYAWVLHPGVLIWELLSLRAPPHLYASHHRLL